MPKRAPARSRPDSIKQIEFYSERDSLLWSDFESDVVEGRYPLGKLVRSEGRCGWFETRFDEKAAIISLIVSLNDEDMLLERLHTAEKIRDNNVAAIYRTGTTKLRQTPLVYAVMEYTEENLEDVLRARALSPEETKEVAAGLVNALRAIHKERLVCVRNGGGRLEAASVLAAGDTVKLRSDYLQLVPKGTPFDPYAAKDVRGLANLLYQCLTQQSLKHALDANDPSLQLLPAPFVQIVRRTLTGQATLDDIAALLRPSAAVSAPVPPNPTHRPVANVLPIKPADPVKKTDRADVKELPLREDASPRRHQNKTWIIAGFVVLLLIAGFVLRAILRSSEHPDMPVKSVTAAAPPAKTATGAVPARSPAPAPLPPAKPRALAASPATSPAGAWRVVAFTYNHEDQAEHKAQTINEKHPDLQAGVFSPKGSGAPYLVTLGTATDRVSAFHMRDKAVQEGLPRDTYAQNYTH